jgi:hypothetical protein
MPPLAAYAGSWGMGSPSSIHCLASLVEEARGSA